MRNKITADEFSFFIAFYAFSFIFIGAMLFGNSVANTCENDIETNESEASERANESVLKTLSSFLTPHPSSLLKWQ
jgi:phosphate/sulfate permease